MFDRLRQIFERYGFDAAAGILVVVLNAQVAKRGDSRLWSLSVEVPWLAHYPNAVVLSNCLLCDVVSSIYSALYRVTQRVNRKTIIPGSLSSVFLGALFLSFPSRRFANFGKKFLSSIV